MSSYERCRALAVGAALSLVFGCSIEPGVNKTLQFPDVSLGELYVVEGVATFGSGPARRRKADARGKVTVKIPTGWLVELRFEH